MICLDCNLSVKSLATFTGGKVKEKKFF